MTHLVATLRLVAVTMLVCCVGYTAVIWTVANTLTPWTAAGHLLTNEAGETVGSRQIAQAFTQPEYFWPRLSAADYDASATGGSNLSPANPELVERLQPVLEAHGAEPGRPLPADLATASGSGMDPHILLDSAIYQAARVARARGLDEQALVQWLRNHADRPGAFLGSGAIVNVLETNIALDKGDAP